MKSVGNEMKSLFANHAAEYRQKEQQVMADPDVQAFLQQHADQVDQAIIKRSMSKLFEFYDEKQRAAKGQVTVAPGYSAHLQMGYRQIDVVYVPTAQLKEQRKKETLKKRLRLLNMPRFIRQASFDDFYMDEQYQSASRQAAFNAAIKFTQEYQPGSFVPGLYLYGSFGVGKTFLLGAIAHQLALQGDTVTMLHFPSFAVQMKNSIKDNTTENLLNTVKSAPVLMIDDIGADAMSAWIRDDVFGIILEYRMQQELPTFFSSNFSMEELEEEHLAVDAQGNQEPLKAKRIMERIQFLSREMPMLGPNLRQKHGRDKA
ncbi:primosomal protein DnaI [Limosilactobacillus difficilis]|uniref:primosomal protein DnaI n=1 Tax=Limosilactobacillus difficilis TaxID=2991838 RepID=UPI0024BA5DA3|nr:primosomal protein DnaI [Limosilactobacillus difficilis]